MEEKKTIRVGAVGFGYRLFAVFTLVQKQAQDNVILDAICDPHPMSRAVAQLLNKDVKIYETHEELSRDKEVDWVFVGSWNNFHRAQVISAFENGKNVFCEKPLATTVEDCIAMKQAWLKTEKKCQFIIGFVLRFTAHYQKIHEVVASGRLGKLISMEFNETLRPDHGGFIMGDWRRKVEYSGGHLLEKTCHDFDLVNWIVNSRAKRVASFGGLDFFTPENEERLKQHPKYDSWGGLVKLNPFTSDKDIVDNQVVIIEYENGVRSTFHTNCNSALHERRIYLNGTLGTLRADLISKKIEVRVIGESEIEIINSERPILGQQKEQFERYYRKLSQSLADSQILQKLGITQKFLDEVLLSTQESHGGGDSVIAKSILEAMFEGKDPNVGIEDGLISAITCLKIDEARAQSKVLDLSDEWSRIDAIFSKN